MPNMEEGGANCLRMPLCWSEGFVRYVDLPQLIDLKSGTDLDLWTYMWLSRSVSKFHFGRCCISQTRLVLLDTRDCQDLIMLHFRLLLR